MSIWGIPYNRQQKRFSPDKDYINLLTPYGLLQVGFNDYFQPYIIFMSYDIIEEISRREEEQQMLNELSYEA